MLILYSIQERKKQLKEGVFLVNLNTVLKHSHSLSNRICPSTLEYITHKDNPLFCALHCPHCLQRSQQIVAQLTYQEQISLSHLYLQNKKGMYM